MNRRRWLYAGAALAAVLSPACGGGGKGPIAITAPAAGAVLTWMPVDIRLDLAGNADPASLVVWLNGNDVTSLFAIDDPPSGRTTAVAEHVWEGFVLPGPNQIAVSVLVEGEEKTAQRSFETQGDPYADALDSLQLGSGGGFGSQDLVLGPPFGLGLFQGSTGDVLSLGFGGAIQLEFSDNVVVDGPGADLTVFENSFLEIGADFYSDPPFAEPARVSVSQDGATWLAFPCTLDLAQAPYFPGCAGIYPVLSNADDPGTPHASIPSAVPIEELVDQDVLAFPVPAGAGGDSFDLADLGLAWIRFVRIESAPFSTGPVGANNAGFDLDAVAAVHSAPATDADGNGVPDAVE